MSGFSPERYLRLLAERALAGDPDLLAGLPRLDEVVHVGAAFATTGVLDRERVRAIVADYRAAADRHAAETSRESPCAPARHPLPARSAFGLSGALTTTFGVVHPMALINAGTARYLPARVTLAEGRPVGSPGAIALRTPSGETATLRFSAVGRHPVEAAGAYEAQLLAGGPGLDPDDIIELNDQPFGLAPAALAPAFALSPLEPCPAAHRLLASLLGDWGDARDVMRHAPSVLEALVAAGALCDPDDLLAGFRWASAELTAPKPRSAGACPRPPVGTPPRWQMAFGRTSAPRAPARDGAAAVGSVSPVFDDVSVAVDLVERRRSEVLVHVEVAGSRPREAGVSPLDRAALSWWLEDDRGNQALGRTFSSAPSGCGIRTVMRFADLDPYAAAVELSVETRSTRARLSLDLDRLRPLVAP